MNELFSESNTNNYSKAKEDAKRSLDRLFHKVNSLVKKFKEISEENKSLKDAIKDLNNRINELKLQLTQTNTDSVLKEKEISDLKNLLLTSGNNKITKQDKDNLRSRIQELISRIDVHLEQYEGDPDEY
jgi:septal ring factor EnvC (AmiA/AmiB activator)